MIRRVIQGGTFLLLACLAAGGYMTLRALVWNYESQAAGAAMAGVRAAALGAGGIALLYVLFGAAVFRWISQQIDWMSVELGMVVGAGLYAAYSLSTSPAGMALDPAARALQGAMDGLILGAGIGLVSYIAVGRKVRLTLGGLIEYTVIFLIMLCALQLAQIIETWGGIPDTTAGLLVLLGVAGGGRLTLYLLDRRADGRRHAAPIPDSAPHTDADPPSHEHAAPTEPVEPAAAYTSDGDYPEDVWSAEPSPEA